MSIFTLFTKTIARRIASAFALVLCLLVGVVFVTLAQMNKQETVTQRTIMIGEPSARLDETIEGGLYQSSAAARGFLLTGGKKFLKQREDAWKDKILPSLAALHELSKDFSNPENRKGLEIVEAVVPEIKALQEQQFQLQQKDPKLAKELEVTKIAPANTTVNIALEAMAADQKQSARQGGQEALRLGRDLRLLLVSLLGIALILGMSIGWLTTRAIVKPVGDLVATAQALASGDLTVTVEQRSEDEIGQLSGAFAAMVGKLRAIIGQTAVNANGLANSSEELSVVSTQMGANAEETSAQSGVVAAAAEQVSQNLHTVATGAEEMMTSIKEIAKSSNEAARVAAQAVQVAANTNLTVGKLGESSAEIGQVIKVITSIAQQTNLLALNAAIEAARAGEAGKGFAVVANEVKELAKETASATEDISRKIDAIQADTQRAVEAIAQIGGIIGRISEIQNTIASAVEQQSATTSEIGRNITQAAKGSNEIAQNIGGVAQAAKSTAEGAGHSQAASTELARMAAELQRLVSQFNIGAGDGVIAALPKHNLRVMSRQAA